MQRNEFTAGELSGMITVEMTYIVPVILSIFFLSVMGIFYYHDKEVIAACAYEAAAAGSIKAREKNGVTDAMIRDIFEERIYGKCILFGEVRGDVLVSEDHILVKASAARGRMRVSVAETASLTEPETKIRRHRKLLGRDVR